MEFITKENFESNYNEKKFNSLYHYLSDSKETVRVLYNSTYGGFMYSEQVEKLLKEKTYSHIYSDRLRSDPYVLELYDELKENFGSAGSSISVRNIPIYLNPYYKIHEYDGKESIEHRENDMKVDLISFIIKSNLNPEQKCILIEMIINKRNEWLY